MKIVWIVLAVLAGLIVLMVVIGALLPKAHTASRSAVIGLAVASGFAIAVGLFAGLYPSLTASRLQPVDALRS